MPPHAAPTTSRHAAPGDGRDTGQEMAAAVAAYAAAERALTDLADQADALASATAHLLGARQTVTAAGDTVEEACAHLDTTAAAVRSAAAELAAVSVAVRAMDASAHGAELARLRNGQRLQLGLLLALIAAVAVLVLTR